MMCLKCDNDISKLVNYDTLTDDYITCPSCNNKMVVEYDESYDEDSNMEDSWRWVEQYEAECDIISHNVDIITNGECSTCHLNKENYKK